MNKARIEHKSIGKRIAWARAEYQLSQAQLAANVGVTRAAISQYEQDKMRPRPKVFDELAKLFDADPEWFERGRGRAPDVLDAPVTILEVNVERLTLRTSGDLRDLHTGLRWRLPAATFEGIELSSNHMVAILAPNDAGPILAGDKVLIDARLRDGEGVYLTVDETGARLQVGCGADAQAVGRAVAYLRRI